MATINGNSGNNNLLGTSTRDTLNGFGGNDTLNGGAGIDTLVGGEGNDIYIVDSTTDIITEYSGGGAHDTVQSSVSYTLGAYLNDLTLTGTSAINGTGNSYDNIITGNDANNVLRGGAGNDRLGSSDSKGNDTLYGGTGNDTLRAGVEAGGQLYGEAGDDTLFREFDFDFNSNPSLYMDGGDGNDTIEGGSGSDVYGGTGNDRLTGDSSIIHGGPGDDIVGEAGDDYGSMYGDDGNDTLRGFENNLYGGNGNDVLYGPVTAMTGGAGADRFVFDTPLSNGYNAYIYDFVVADDTINVSANAFGGGLTRGAAIRQEQFALGSSASNTSQRFIYDKFSTGELYFDVDGSGGAAQTLIVSLDPGLALTRNDIVVIA